MEFDPHGIFAREPWEARQILERVATDANRASPGNWRVPVMAMLDAIFVQGRTPPKTTRKYRSRQRPCGCGCGTMVKPTGSRGPAPKYVNNTHSKRAQRAARARQTEVKAAAQNILAEAISKQPL